MSENRYRLAEKIWGPSIQGEGKYAGSPSVWVRTYGCNLKCPGFPCDTEYAWNPGMRDDSLFFTAKEIVDQLCALVVAKDNPNGLFHHPITRNKMHVLFTGGEPLLLKYQKLFIEVMDLIHSDEYIDRWFPLSAIQSNDEWDYRETLMVTFESNGTQKLSKEFKESLEKYDDVDVFFSLSPKLYAASGEKDAVNIQNINDILQDYMCNLKFVCDESDECADELDDVVKRLYEHAHNDEEKYNWHKFSEDFIWVMPKGTTKEDQLEIAPIVEKYQEKGYKIATRNHTYIWSDAKGR